MTLAKAASLVALVVVFPAACSSSGGSPSAGETAGWTMAGPVAIDAVLDSVWADGADVYAASLSDGASPFVFSSHNRGATWASVPVANAQAGLTGVTATGNGDVYVVGYTNPFIDVANTGPLLLKSTDGGATFATLAPDLQGAIFAVWADPQRGLYVAGGDSAGGFFARSADGGLDWTQTMIPGSSYLSGLWVSASGDIYAAGGAVFKSTDEGATWAVVATPPTEATAISGSPDGARIVASGAGLLVVESLDGGATWQVLSGSAALVESDAPALGGVWVADAVSDPYFAAGRSGVLRTISTGDAPGAPFVTGGDFLPDTPIIRAVTGDATDVWAVGGSIANAMSAVYRKPLGL